MEAVLAETRSLGFPGLAKFKDLVCQISGDSFNTLVPGFIIYRREGCARQVLAFRKSFQVP